MPSIPRLRGILNECVQCHEVVTSEATPDAPCPRGGRHRWEPLRGDDPRVSIITASRRIPRRSSTSSQLVELSRRIDAKSGARHPESLTWGRIARLTEDAGDVTKAYVAATGPDPARGDNLERVILGLLDVATSALGAVVHVTGNRPAEQVDVMRLLAEHVDRTTKRAKS